MMHSDLRFSEVQTNLILPIVGHPARAGSPSSCLDRAMSRHTQAGNIPLSPQPFLDSVSALPTAGYSNSVTVEPVKMDE